MIFEDVINFFKNVPPFQFLEDAALKDIVSNLSMEFYPKDAVILQQDGPASDSLRIIKKGGVKVFIKHGSGEDVVIDYRGEGDTFGLWSLVGAEKQKTNVVAVDDTICYLLSRHKVMELLNTNATFTEYFLKSHISKYMDKTYKEMHSKSLLYGGTDRILFTTQIGDIATKKVITVNEEMTIQEAAQIMAKNKISSLVILNRHDLPTGIVTDRDLREKVVAKGRDINESIKNIMSMPLIRVETSDYCFEAVLKMISHNVHHILVIKEGRLKGVITNHDLMMLQGISPLSFAKDIENQQSIDGLVPVSGKINKIVRLLLKEGAKASNIARIITELNDRLVRKVLELSERKFGNPPVPYCWIVFGSEGRREQTFKTDQDNAIIYAETEEGSEEIKKYFSEFALFVRDTLIKCGFPLCPADYMASNPQWCQPLNAWKKYFSNWISTPTPDAVLKSLIFFDFRPLFGEFSLAEDLRDYLIKALRGQKIFLAQMAGVITENMPPLGFFKTFIVEKSGEHKNKLNLKVRGIGPLIDLVRFFALESGIRETSTLGRIEALKERHHVIRETGSDLAQVFELISLLRIHHQVEQIETGLSPDNFINPAKMSNLEKKSLKDAFQIISRVQDIIIDQYMPGMVGG